MAECKWQISRECLAFEFQMSRPSYLEARAVNKRNLCVCSHRLKFPGLGQEKELEGEQVYVLEKSLPFKAESKDGK